jgi:hypothetical protein
VADRLVAKQGGKGKTVQFYGIGGKLESLGCGQVGMFEGKAPSPLLDIEACAGCSACCLYTCKSLAYGGEQQLDAC